MTNPADDGAPGGVPVTIAVDGRPVTARYGMTVAAALLNAGVTGFRVSVGGTPRAPLCGMGTCFECRVMIDGEAHVRACMVPVREGMAVRTGVGGTGADGGDRC